MHKTILTIVLTMLFVWNDFAQTIPIGKYVGYEPMWISNRGELSAAPGNGFVKQSDSTKEWYHSSVWFHEVTVKVKSDKKISIHKIPVYFKNGVKFYSDSIGGFFYYNKMALERYSIYAPDVSIRGKPFVFGFLTKKIKGTPFYSDAIPRYYILSCSVKTADAEHLVLETIYGTLEYRKQ